MEYIELVMCILVLIMVVNYYFVLFKKYVRDVDGEWYDVNIVEDYLIYQVGDEVLYWIVIMNIGQGIFIDLEIIDDLFFEGFFMVDQFVFGVEEMYEFIVIVFVGGLDMIVNIVCVIVVIFEDLQVFLIINCDFVGIEVIGDLIYIKEFVLVILIGNGQWQVVYGIDVMNMLMNVMCYDLVDMLWFIDQVMIVLVEVIILFVGVMLVDLVWDGQVVILIVGDVFLFGIDDVGYVVYCYEVIVIVIVLLQFEGVGFGVDDLIQCGFDGDIVNWVFNNILQMIKFDGEMEDGQVCVLILFFIIIKGVLLGFMVNGDGIWMVMYDIVVINIGGVVEVYDVMDQMIVDGDLEVIFGVIIFVLEGVIILLMWMGLGVVGVLENVIVIGVMLFVGGVYIYQVEVVIGFVEGIEGVFVIIDCLVEFGGLGGLLNFVEFVYNDFMDDVMVCIMVGIVMVDKMVFLGLIFNGDGIWIVVYDIVVIYVGEVVVDYDVIDCLCFGDGIEIVDYEVCLFDGIDVNFGWIGFGVIDFVLENVIVEDIMLDVGELYMYQVEVIVQMDEEIIDLGEFVCFVLGSGELGGFVNLIILISNGIFVKDEVCLMIIIIDFDKMVVEGSLIFNGDGIWMIVYDVIVINCGMVVGIYDVSDCFCYGVGIEVELVMIVSGFDGVIVNLGWIGQGVEDVVENVIVIGIMFDVGEVYIYCVEVVVLMDCVVVILGDFVCFVFGLGEFGVFLNIVGFVYNGELQEVEVCVLVLLIMIIKFFLGVVMLVDGQDGVYDVIYEIIVINSGIGVGVYDFDDQFVFGEGVSVVGIQGVFSDVLNFVVINFGFDGFDDQWIVMGQLIVGVVEGVQVVYIYLVIVWYVVDLVGIEVLVGDSCFGENGELFFGMLNNMVMVGWNGFDEDDVVCIVFGKLMLDKVIVLVNLIGNGQWEVVYDFMVGNIGNEVIIYDLDDEFFFVLQVMVDIVFVMGFEGIVINGGFDGVDDQCIVIDVDIIGFDDDGYVLYVYWVMVVVNVLLMFDFVDVDSDGIVFLVCIVVLGGNFLEQGLNNVVIFMDLIGGIVIDMDCVGLLLMKVSKVMDGVFVKSVNGYWIVNYMFIVFNDGVVQGFYMLIDQFCYGVGIEVFEVIVIFVFEGVIFVVMWMGQGVKDVVENVVVMDVVLVVGGLYVYWVMIEMSFDMVVVDGMMLICLVLGLDD